MNNFKVTVVMISALTVVGCGQKQDNASLPPEQVLTGNAILAPQQQTMDVKNMALVPVGTTMVVPANQTSTAGVAAISEPPTMELVTTVSSGKPSEKDIQQALKNAGVYTGPVDGNIGAKSKKAIKLFQEKNGLTADGKVGPRTWKKLSTYLTNSPMETVPAGGVSN